ncbi:MAG: efflux RND transporter periplasmic adaptor subunit [Proteobacteria bacterium]|nr:efflux RND transporter periplasmic adaptor subunit [Pseudomonadota bacterium]
MNNTNMPTGRPWTSHPLTSRKRLGWSVSLLLGAIVAGLVVAWSWHRTAHAQTDAAATTSSVAVVKVDREDLFKELTIPAEFRPYNEVDLHAKVSGYVQRMNVDIGDKVQAGQLLAVLEIPELHDELDHASAAEQRAAADYKDAHLAYTRLLEVNKAHPNLIAQQDLDTAEARDATAQGALAGARSDVQKFRTLVSYTQITAPFGGVITKRYADPGALIQAGTASQQTMPLVRLSDNNLLRLDFPVSVDYVSGIQRNAAVSVKVDSLGNRTFEGKVARFSNQIDDSTRTMIVEMEVPNPTLELVPGMYANVTLKVDQRSNALAIPVEAIPPGGKSVLVVNAAHQVEERPVKLGIETPSKYEVLSGLAEGDLVMLGNPAQVTVGQKVDPRITAPLARE